MAEAVFRHLVNTNNLQDRFARIASAGTAGYHVGERPDSRSISTCKKYGVPVESRAQQVDPSDFDSFDYILAMDTSNLQDLNRIRPPQSKAQVKLFGEFGDGQIVKDPYYGANDGFEYNFKQCTEYSIGLLKTLGFDSVRSIL